MTTESLADRPLVGRHEAVRELETAVAQASAGQSGLVLVAGEPGIGKTHLAQHVASRAAVDGTRVLWATCWEGEGAPPFWPWIQVLRAYARSGTPAGFQADLGPQAAEISTLVPELVVGSADTPPLSTAAPSPGSRFRLFDSLGRFLRRASLQRPMLLVLDDLHWADEPSVEMLRFLAGDLQQSRLLLLGTYRDVEVRPEHPLTRLIGQLTVARHLTLEGLSHDDLAELVTELTGTRPSDDGVLLHRQTKGNPFFVRELVTLHGGAVVATPWMPQGVGHVIRRRLEVLTTPCRDLLAAASVLGAEFEPRLVSRVARVPVREASALLEEARRTRLVEETGVIGHDRFVHALVREVLYADLESSRRRQLHHRAATAIEAEYAGQLDGWEAVLAHHYREAGGTADLTRALGFSEAAGERSLRLVAHEDASAHLQQTLDLLARVDPLDARRRCLLLLSLARAQMAAGQGAASRETSDRAAAVARGAGAVDLLAQAALGLQPEFTAGGVDDLEVGLLEEALDGLGDDRPELQARLLARLARALLLSPLAARRQQLADQAEALARRLNDSATLAAVLYERHQAVWGLPTDDPASRLRIAEEVIRLTDQTGDAALALNAQALLVGDLLELGQMDRLRAEMASFAAAVGRRRQVQLAWAPPLQRATLASLEGRFDEAARLAEEGLALGRRVQHVGIENSYNALLACSRFLQGRAAEGVDALRWAVPAAPVFPAFRAALAHALLESGRREHGELEFERLAAGDFRDLPQDYLRVLSLATLSVACSVLEDHRRAALLYELLLPWADCNVRATRVGIGCLGSVQLYLGLLCSTLGRTDEAVSRFEAAVADNQSLGSPVLVAWSRYRLATALERRAGEGDEERARAELVAAGRTAAALGVHLGQAEPPRHRVELRREGDVWTLVRGDRLARLRDSVGLRHLARLLTEPGREILALDLVSPGSGRDQGAAVSGPLLDDRARNEYRARMHELAREIEEAESWGDLERAANARREVDVLTEHLTQAAGFGGRGRRVASQAERARVTVTKAIRGALRRIALQDAQLGAHLEVSVHTGSFCSYRPDPESRITWTVTM